MISWLGLPLAVSSKGLGGRRFSSVTSHGAGTAYSGVIYNTDIWEGEGYS